MPLQQVQQRPTHTRHWQLRVAIPVWGTKAAICLALRGGAGAGRCTIVFFFVIFEIIIVIVAVTYWAPGALEGMLLVLSITPSSACTPAASSLLSQLLAP